MARKDLSGSALRILRRRHLPPHRPESSAMAYHDILYDKRDGVATITINRPKVLNAFRAETVEEMLAAMRDADNDPDIGVIVLAGAGDRAFCSGGDNSARSSGSESEEGDGGRGLVGPAVGRIQKQRRA